MLTARARARAGDETLRFWNVFPKAQTAATLTSLSDGSQRSRIR